MSTLLCLIGLVLTSAAAIVCPDATWLERNGKCYSKRGMGTHTNCATTICGANASLVHITSPDENAFVQFEARGSRVWIGYYKIMHPADPHADGLWGRWTSSSEMTDGAYTNWDTDQPNDNYQAQNCAIMKSDETWEDDQCTDTRACLCEYPASTTREYAEMVPLLEEDLFTLYNTTTFRVVLACVLTGIAIMQELKAKAKKISRTYYKAAPTEKEAKTDEFDEGRAPRRNSRRSSQRSVSIHLQHVREEITDKNATPNLGVARLDVAMVMAGVRLPFMKKGPQVMEDRDGRSECRARRDIMVFDLSGSRLSGSWSPSSRADRCFCICMVGSCKLAPPFDGRFNVCRRPDASALHDRGCETR